MTKKLPSKLSVERMSGWDVPVIELTRRYNDLVDYLQANQTKEKSYKSASSLCCDSSFRVEGDETMFHICNNCNKACDIKLTEKKVEASKRECNCLCHHDRKPTPEEYCSRSCALNKFRELKKQVKELYSTLISKY